MTKQELAYHLNVQPHQVSKYENADNRIASSKLYEISKVLTVKVSYFFEELEGISHPASNSAKFVPQLEQITVSEVQRSWSNSHLSIKERLEYIVDLILNERAKFSLLPIPNEPKALELYQQEETFLRTIEANIISIHRDLPEATNINLSEAEAASLKEVLIEVAKAADRTIKFLDKETGTYGGLYKIGLISALAGALSLIPGVSFLAGAALPAAIFGAQTVRLQVKRESQPEAKSR